MRKNILTVFSLALLISGCLEKEEPTLRFVEYVDTKIGVIDNRGSNCVIGPKLPYGSINPSLQTIEGGMDGYHPDKPIRGFAQLQASGAGWGAYGHFLISPLTGALNTGLDAHDSPHSEDITKAYYYKTELNRYDIRAEIAPSHYSAIYRFTYPASEKSHLIFDASQAIPSDIVPKMNGTVLESSASIDETKQQIRMKIRYKGGWVDGPYDLYLAGQYNKPATEAGIWKNDSIISNRQEVAANASNHHLGAYLTFSTQEKEEVLLKVAISFNGYDRAEALLAQEIADWDFEKVKRQGAEKWDNKLSCIEIETPSDKEKAIFYSALYRFFTLASDRTLDGPDWAAGKPYWDDLYAFWDTFRSAYPLMMLVDELAARDNILAMIDRFEHNGVVCDGFIAGRERYGEQGGNDVDNIIAEACLKDITGIDWNKAYQILKYNANHRRIGHHTSATQGNGFERYKEWGWMPNGVMSTSQTLEFAYNDYCVAMMAKKLKLEEDYEKFLKRSHQWIHLWNPNQESEGYKGFIDAREENGTFAFYDTKKYGGSWKGPFYEGSPWTYSYFAPHDIDTLIELMGGKELFTERLNMAHEKKLIDYTNEPSFLATRLFINAGRHDLTSYWVHQIMKNEYDLAGYPQNDDTGAMASWYVFSSMGLFPNAGQDYYYLNAPLYCKSIIHLLNGKTLTIEANDKSDETIYMSSFKLNGKPLDKPIIRRQDIVNGGVVKINLTNHKQ
jgi:predicted alpha-1,2-mannosidase